MKKKNETWEFTIGKTSTVEIIANYCLIEYKVKKIYNSFYKNPPFFAVIIPIINNKIIIPVIYRVLGQIFYLHKNHMR